MPTETTAMEMCERMSTRRERRNKKGKNKNTGESAEGKFYEYATEAKEKMSSIEHLEAFVDWMTEEGDIAGSTIKTYLSTCYHAIIKAGLQVDRTAYESIIRAVKLGQPHKARPITVPECQSLSRKSRWRVWFMCQTGNRAGAYTTTQQRQISRAGKDIKISFSRDKVTEKINF